MIHLILSSLISILFVNSDQTAAGGPKLVVGYSKEEVE